MTALRCKPGDLAIVISATIPENIGNLVEVVGPTTGLPVKAHWQCATWQVRTVSGRKTLVYKLGNKRTSRVERHAEGPVQDFKLRPLPGVEEIDEFERSVEIPVETRIAAEVS
jgi:hypothetical protein